MTLSVSTVSMHGAILQLYGYVMSMLKFSYLLKQYVDRNYSYRNYAGITCVVHNLHNEPFPFPCRKCVRLHFRI